MAITPALIKKPLRRLPSSVAGRRFVGVDLTAGSWSTLLDGGNPRRPFPVVELTGQPDGSLSPATICDCTKLQEFLDLKWTVAADRLVIDGPCKTNGIALLSPPTNWNFTDATPGVRLAEQQLAAMDVGLFWTTFATLQRFDGASRWIARSIRLFDLLSQNPTTAGKCLETHPHAVFLMLHRSLGDGPLFPKTTAKGRVQRIDILKRLMPKLNADQLPSHDHVDAAAAAMLGAMHWCGQATSLGDALGGNIWIPDLPAIFG